MIRMATAVLVLSMFAAVLKADEPDIEKSIEKASDLLDTERDQEGKKQLTSILVTLADRIRKEPKSADLHRLAGLVHQYLGKFDESIKECDAAIAIDSKNAEAHYLKGRSLWQLEKLDRAIKELEKARSLDSKNLDYASHLGEALMANNELARAEVVLKEVVAQDPKDARAWLDLSIIDHDLGRPEAGLEKVRKVITLQPDNAMALYNAGQGCQTLGRHKESLEYFQSVAKLEPDNERVAAKIMQCQQALNLLKERDKTRETILKLFKDKKTDREFFVRDQFHVGDMEVMALEYFELMGERPVRYSFPVRRKGGDDPDYRISVGSYDSTNAIGQEHEKLPAGKRYFHIDRYWPNGAHETFGFFKGEPAYDEVRKQVMDIVSGKAKPESATVPPARDDD